MSSAGITEAEAEGRILEVWELVVTRLPFTDKLPLCVALSGGADVDLEEVAVGAEHCLSKDERLVAACPVECGFEHHFLLGLDLRFVEARSWLGFAEDVEDAVVADAVACAKAGVGVVIERAPGDAARILGSGGELIVDAHVAERVFALALVLVG